ncbi:MAG: ATP-binding protein [Acidimicrobiales bacterium]
MLESPGTTPPAPGEVTTFLFTDIEASTRRWESDPQAMGEDLARHDLLVRSAVEAAGGEIFGHTGDGLCAAFADPGAGVRAAVAAQLALQKAVWSGPLPLRARMALHAGTAERRAGNYFGPTLNRAARLLAIGWGGQVLCSEPIAALLRNDLDPDVTLLDLGEHSLVDLVRPERVFQVAHPGLESEFPIVRSLLAHRHNLPIALTHFVGRALELQEIDTLLAASRLVTLIGVGGAGKTRLAFQAAGAALERYPDGVWLVELAAVSDDRAVPAALRAVLGVMASGPDGAEATEEAVAAYLAGKSMLLLFDNCEHLIGGVARLVHRLLARCPAIRALATSREALGLPGEVTLAVPPLSLPPSNPAGTGDVAGSDAVALFCERVQAARPQFRLTPANAGAVARVCRRLDGIPLAIELAAAWARMLGVEQIEQRLGDYFRLLVGGARTAMPHHQTMRAALDWSHDLLSPAEQAALRHLAVFPGRFGLDAALALVAGDAPDVTVPDGDSDGFELVSHLIDKSLVAVHGDGDELRYRLLEPVRRYAAEKLASAGETQATRRRLCSFFVARADVCIGNPKLHRVAADQENFSAALEWSWSESDIEAATRLVAALSASWLFAGDPQGREWSERVVAASAVVEHRSRVYALIYLAFMLHDSDRPDPGREEALLGEAGDLARRLVDAAAIAWCDFALGEFKLAHGESEEARGLIQAALGIYEDVGRPYGVCLCNDHLGWVAVAENDHERARRHFERAAEVALSHDWGRWAAAGAQAALAPLIVLLGEPERGVRLAEAAISTARGLSDAGTLLMTLARSAETAVLAGHNARATEMLAELLRLLHDLGTRRWLADALELAALLLESRGETGLATEIFGASAALREAAGEPFGGIRSVAPEVQRGRDRLIATLGADAYAAHQARGRQQGPQSAVTEALTRLGAQVSRRP